MEQLLQKILDAAKEELIANGNAEPRMMWAREGKLLSFMQPCFSKSLDANFDNEKEACFHALGFIAANVKADTVIWVWDCAFISAPAGTKYDETMAPTTFPRSMRTEAIMVNTLTVPAGREDFLFAPYKGGGETKEPVVFIDMKLPKGLRIENRFKEIILKGYADAKSH